MIDEDEDSGFLIRRASQDKLTYKNTIQRCIDWCLRAMGTFLFPMAVKSLERAIIFDIKGYKFKTNIEQIHIKANQFQQEEKIRLKNKLGRRFYKNAIQAKYKLQRENQYWLYIFDELMQLIADHNLLIEYQKTITVKEAGKTGDEFESEE